MAARPALTSCGPARRPRAAASAASPGVAPAHVVVIGGGVVGTGGRADSLGLEAEVTILERSLERLHELDRSTSDRGPGSSCQTPSSWRRLCGKRTSSSVPCSCPVPSPRLVTREMLSWMKRGAVMVDVAIDQGGCFETSHPTTHTDPVFEVEDILHYCVANMPGAVPVTSTRALTNATMPYVRRLAEQGIDAALAEDPARTRTQRPKREDHLRARRHGVRRRATGCPLVTQRHDDAVVGVLGIGEGESAVDLQGGAGGVVRVGPDEGVVDALGLTGEQEVPKPV